MISKTAVTSPAPAPSGLVTQIKTDRKMVGIQWLPSTTERIRLYLESVQWATSSIMIQSHHVTAAGKTFICMEEKMNPSSARVQALMLKLSNPTHWTIHAPAPTAHVTSSSANISGEREMSSTWSIRMTCADLLEIFRGGGVSTPVTSNITATVTAQTCGWKAFEWIRKTNETFLVTEDGKRYRCYFYSTDQPCICQRVPTVADDTWSMTTRDITGWISLFHRLAWIYSIFHIRIVPSCQLLQLQSISSDSEIHILVFLNGSQKQKKRQVDNNDGDVEKTKNGITQQQHAMASNTKRLKIKDRVQALVDKIKDTPPALSLSTPSSSSISQQSRLWTLHGPSPKTTVTTTPIPSTTTTVSQSSELDSIIPTTAGFYQKYYLSASEWTDPQVWADHRLTLEDVRQLYTGFSAQMLGKLCMREMGVPMYTSMIKIRDSLGDDHSYIGRQLEYTCRTSLLTALMKCYLTRYSNFLSTAQQSRTRTWLHHEDSFVKTHKPELPLHVIEDSMFEQIQHITRSADLCTIQDMLFLNATKSDLLGDYMNDRLPDWLTQRLTEMDEKKKKIVIYKEIVRWKNDVWVIPININTTHKILLMQRVWIYHSTSTTATDDPSGSDTNVYVGRRRISEEEINARQQSYLGTPSYEPHLVGLHLPDHHILFGLIMEESFFLCRKTYYDSHQQSTTNTTSTKRTKRSFTKS